MHSKKNTADCEQLARHNMEKCLEDTVFYLMEELNSYNCLLHDIFVRELTGEGLQDLINKKLYNAQTQKVNLHEYKQLSTVPPIQAVL